MTTSASPEPLVLVVPQWQGSSVPDAKALADGALRSARLFRPEAAVEIDVDEAAEPGDQDRASAPVRNAAALVRNAARVRTALAAAPGRPTVTLGGDCAVELEPVAAAVARLGRDVAVVWFDAHGDINVPAESPSGAFHGMILRTLLGEGPADLLPPENARLTHDRVVLAGTRALDDAEQAYLTKTGIRVVRTVDEPDALVDAVAATGASQVYLHIDLDVLDPAEFHGLSYREPDGVTAKHLCAALRALTGRFALAGLAVTEHAPAADPEGAAEDAAVLREIFTAAGLADLLREDAVR